MKPCPRTFFTNLQSSDADGMYAQTCLNSVVIEANPIGFIPATVKPYIGLEFDCANDSRDFYNVYATNTGFQIRIGQLYRSRVDGTISSRKFVCSKEGNQLHSRTGCPAFMRVKVLESGKWVIDQFREDHNHNLLSPGDVRPSVYQGKHPAALKSLDDVSSRSSVGSLEEEDQPQPCPSGIITVKRMKTGVGGATIAEPYVSLEFNSANEAYKFYLAYAAGSGFKVRIGQLFRSKNDGSITSRRLVCSKEGYQHPSRIGCGAYMRIKRQDPGKWVVDRLQKEHNHDLWVIHEATKKIPTALAEYREYVDCAMVGRKIQESGIRSEWYPVLLEYFQTRQTLDTGFFHALDVGEGKCRSVFWADGKSRFSCSQFGDAVVFDTSYRSTDYLVPFATFSGVNNHKQPVLFGCALLADESKESFTWLFRTYLRAMSGHRPVSIIADQDIAIEESISEIFLGAQHCYSMWQMKKRQQENMIPLLANGIDFRYDFEKCINTSQTVREFEMSWIEFISKHNLKENAWIKEMYEKRENWVPLFVRSTFFAGIRIDGNDTSLFGTFLNVQTPLCEFFERYERGLKRLREEEVKENMQSSISPAILRTKEPMEEQCRRVYTITMFHVFQKELLDSFSYISLRIYDEGVISKYLVKKNENGIDDRHTVILNTSDNSVNCSCQMFEFEGMLCRHVLKVFQHVNVREIPSRYILHRWTRNAQYAVLGDGETGSSSQDLRTLIIWSLREEATNFIEAGAMSAENYKLALEIMREGKRDISWQN